MRKVIICAVIIITGSTGLLNGNPAALAKFQERMQSISTMRGTITINSGDGMVTTGDFAYKAPNKIKVNLGSGKVITTNGTRLWVYDSSSQICGVQDVGGGNSGGIASMVGGSSAIVSSSGSGYVIKLAGSYYDEITIAVDSTYMMKSVNFGGAGGFSVSFSGVTVGGNLPSGMFDYSPPADTQIVNNPLNIR